MHYSVLMSVYYKEQPEWLTSSIESILRQTVKPSQFVIVKDGPITEELDRVLDFYARAVPDIFKIVTLDKNCGLGPALATGLKACDFELVARMDSDDESSLSRCEEQLALFAQNPELDVVGCFESEFEDTPDNVISIHKVPETNEEIHRFMRRRCALLHPTVMFKKQAVIDCGNYRSVLLYEDYDLFVRMVQNGARCYNIQKPLYHMRINDEFFKRRGGIVYMKTALRFLVGLFRQRFMGPFDFLASSCSRIIMCLLPNNLRRFLYIKVLR